MKLSECNLVQLELQKRQLIESSDEEWKQTIFYEGRMSEINRCIEVLKLNIPYVSVAKRKLPVAYVILRNAKLMDKEHFNSWYNEATGNSR